MYYNYKTYVSSRILSRSIKQDSGCIEYQGNWKHAYGLISITFNGKQSRVPAHRAMYMALHDKFDLPRSIQIRHKCDNPRCVNDKHLLEGTAKDNAQDKLRRGRNAKKYKLHTRQRIVSDDIVRAIRTATGKQKHIAAQFGVSLGYVSKLCSGSAKTLV